MDYMDLQILSRMDIKEHHKNIIDELNNDHITKQRRRYLESYLQDLDRYIGRHRNATKVPTPLELYCDGNPDAPECRKYDI